MIQRWINKKQYVCFSIDELFAWQDSLDEIEKEPFKAWNLFNDFLDEAENQLEYSEEFIKEMEEIHKKVESGDYSDFVSFEDEMSDDELGKCCHTYNFCISDAEEILKMLNDQDKEIKILNQRIKILREEIQSTVYILKMQTRKLEGY